MSLVSHGMVSASRRAGGKKRNLDQKG